MGGMVGQTIACYYPEMVEALVLCSTSSRITQDQKQQLELWKSLAESEDVIRLMESFGEKVYSPSFYRNYHDTIVASGDGASETDYRNFIISIDAVSCFDINDRLDDIDCAVLVIGAGEDQVVGVQASYDLAEKLDCSYYIYEGYGHAAYDEAPDYLVHINDFLSTLK